MATLLLSAFVTYRIFRSRGPMQQLFDDFDSSLPTLTTFVLSGWYAWLVPTLAVMGVAKEVIVRSRRITLICNGIHLAFVIAVWQLYIDGVIGPFLQLMHDLQ
jgi:hypothetical protein